MRKTCVMMHRSTTGSELCLDYAAALAKVFVAITLAFCGTVASAEVCQVPSGSYPTIQAAVDAPVCDEVVLAAQTFRESVVISRSLELRGVSGGATTIEGQVTVEGEATLVTIEDLAVDTSVGGVAGNYIDALLVTSGAEFNGLRIVVRNAAIDQQPIFSDGFESGDTSAWSGATP